MSIQIKDRVKLKKRKVKLTKGQLLNCIQRKSNIIKTAGVLWDGDWPRAVDFNPRLQPGRVFYYKPEDLRNYRHLAYLNE